MYLQLCSTIAASVACNSGASGVVNCAGNESAPIEIPVVPINPDSRWLIFQSWLRSEAVVVLPFVPVIPVANRDRNGAE